MLSDFLMRAVDLIFNRVVNPNFISYVKANMPLAIRIVGDPRYLRSAFAERGGRVHEYYEAEDCSTGYTAYANWLFKD